MWFKFESKTHLSDSSYPVRLKYRDSANTVRVGRLLEDFDSMAVATSYKHNEQLERARRILVMIDPWLTCGVTIRGQSNIAPKRKMKMVVFHFKLLQLALTTSVSMSHFTSTRLAMICS